MTDPRYDSLVDQDSPYGWADIVETVCREHPQASESEICRLAERDYQDWLYYENHPEVGYT